MDRKIRWSILASSQYERTLRFWVNQNSNNNYSKFLFLETTKITKLLIKFPSIGRKTNNDGIRRILIDQTYALYYSYDESVVDIKLWRSVKMDPEENKYEI